MYIYQRSAWPDFTWDQQLIAEQLAEVKFHQGLLLGKMSAIGFALREEAGLQTQTLNIIKSSAIEGEKLSSDEVRSSIAKQLGLKNAGLTPVQRSIEGVVKMHLDAVKFNSKPLTLKRLCHWHALLFPSGHIGMQIINPGCLRTDREGPMQVISGGYGREKIHFQAPSAKILSRELKQFLLWFNEPSEIDFLVKAGIAHLWFVTLHPFDDGNGRIARCIADLLLSRSDGQANRYYSMSTQILLERKKYYDMLESTQKGNLKITEWLIWFLACLDRAILRADEILVYILNKATFWEQYASHGFNERQIKIINLLFDGFVGKLTSTKWAKMNSCSQDTAARDIQALMNHGVLVKSDEGGRSTHYILKNFPINYKESN